MNDRNERASGVMYLTVKKDEQYSRKLRPVKMTAAPPRSLGAGDVVVKVNVSVPLSAFRPLDGGELDVLDTGTVYAAVTQ